MLGGKPLSLMVTNASGTACAPGCPVGAITMVMASPSMGRLPHLTPEFETSVPNLFIVGQLGGLVFDQNAINEGRDCTDISPTGSPDCGKENQTPRSWILSS